jgi:hypothetical protein
LAKEFRRHHLNRKELGVVAQAVIPVVVGNAK